MKIKALIIDDEPGARRILELFVSRSDDLHLVDAVGSAAEAIECMNKQVVELILLDISMPELNGFDLLEKLHKPPMVIFITAYTDFAVKSYEVNAIDYLKKPVSYDRFRKAIRKAIKMIQLRNTEQEKPEPIPFRIDGQIKSIPVSEILYFESMGNYIKIHTQKKMHLTQITTKEIENNLPPECFIRIHKSFIVNLASIEVIMDEQMKLNNDKILPIGRTFKKYVHTSLEKLGVNLANPELR